MTRLQAIKHCFQFRCIAGSFQEAEGGLQSSYFSSPNSWQAVNVILYPQQLLFGLTPISLCWNHQFQTSDFNVLSPLGSTRLTKQMTQIPKMPQQNTWPFLPLPLHPHRGWNVQLSLATGHQVNLFFLPSWPTLHRHEGNTDKSFKTAGGQDLSCSPVEMPRLGELTEVCLKSGWRHTVRFFFWLTGWG